MKFIINNTGSTKKITTSNTRRYFIFNKKINDMYIVQFRMLESYNPNKPLGRYFSCKIHDCD